MGEYYLGHGLTSYPFVQTGAGHLVDEGVADQNGDDEYQIYAAREGVEAHLVEVVECGREDEALDAEQHEERELTQAGHEGQQVAADDGRLLDGYDPLSRPRAGAWS